MAQVSKELITELQMIIREEYKQEVSFEQASEIANNIVQYVGVLADINSDGKKNPS